MLDNENFRIAVINNIKNSSTLISETLRDYGYECISYNSADIAYKNIVNDNLDLIIINSDESTNIQKEIIQNIKSISTVNIIFLTSEIDDIIKNDFLNLYLLDYKIKLNNILTILSEIDTLIKRLILNQKETILIIRKENDVRVQIESLLKLRNYNLILASNGALGWKALSNTNDISMILLDINLRDMDSLEIIAKAKNKFSKDIPIIALTTIYNPITLQQNISNGLSDLIKIPIINEEFNLKIDLWIDNVRQKKEIYKQQVQLEQTLNGFIALSNATIEGLIMFENNICVDANEEALKLFKYDNKDDLLGENILRIVPDNLSDFDKEELLKNDVDHGFEILMCKKDGTIFPTQIKERNLILDNKQLKIIAVLDLTDIKRKESMLYQQSKMAAMGEMMANIAHQWRQPLTAISISASGMKLHKELDILEDDEMSEQLDGIVESTEFLSHTIDDFQNFLKDKKIKENFKLENVIQKVLKLVSGNLKSVSIIINEEYEQSFNLFGLHNELVQSLLNIINNAKDALVENGLNVKLIDIKTKLDTSSNNIILIIQDNAGGIPSHIIDKIFEPYFTTKHQAQGTGLGLYMTHLMLVDNMGGKLEVKNNEIIFEDITYIGAEFKITIPFKD